MSYYDFLGMLSVALLVISLAIGWWAFHPRNKARFDAAAQLPFADEAPRTQERHTDV
ncbi:MAG: cbb3-type cytochrome c oxidase subunit 3 [Gammaproteobacteria bacterium]|nr:cbb3-type cytochrome c oxidase subunit 3 [Gammaproteobacteria bacterium]